MLGLIVGFHVSGEATLSVMVNTSFAVTIALGMSGVTSAYLSEAAEKRVELRELERAMISDLGDTTHGRAARLLPFVIAAVNGFAPMIFAFLIMLPLLMVYVWKVPLAPLETSFGVALALIFMLGVYLGRISGVFWLWAGIRTLLIASATALLIFLTTLRGLD